MKQKHLIRGESRIEHIADGVEGAVLHFVAVGEAVHAAVLQLHEHVVPCLQRVRECVRVLPAPLVVAAAHLRPYMHSRSSAGAGPAAAWASGRPWSLTTPRGLPASCHIAPQKHYNARSSFAGFTRDCISKVQATGCRSILLRLATSHWQRSRRTHICWGWKVSPDMRRHCEYCAAEN